MVAIVGTTVCEAWARVVHPAPCIPPFLACPAIEEEWLGMRQIESYLLLASVLYSTVWIVSFVACASFLLSYMAVEEGSSFRPWWDWCTLWDCWGHLRATCESSPLSIECISQNSYLFIMFSEMIHCLSNTGYLEVQIELYYKLLWKPHHHHEHPMLHVCAIVNT